MRLLYKSRLMGGKQKKDRHMDGLCKEQLKGARRGSVTADTNGSRLAPWRRTIPLGRPMRFSQIVARQAAQQTRFPWLQLKTTGGLPGGHLGKGHRPGAHAGSNGRTELIQVVNQIRDQVKDGQAYIYVQDKGDPRQVDLIKILKLTESEK